MANIPLNGAWRIRTDSGNVGLAEGWFREPAVFLADGVTEPIEVPSAWQHVLGESYHYLAWYRRIVTLPLDWMHTRTRVRFESVATGIDIWVNGRHLERHVGDWIPFEVDSTDVVAASRTIDIVLRVDEMLGHITKGFHDMLSIHHGGVWGDVRIVGSGEVYARTNGIAVRRDRLTKEVEVTVELADGSEVEGTLRANIQSPDGAIAAHETPIAGRRVPSVRIPLPVVEPWSPEKPALYDVTVELIDTRGETDRHALRTGFRTLEIEGTHVLLNGSPFHLRGVLHWGHEPKHLSPAPPPEQVRREFRHLRDLGFNCVCLCMWYPPPHYFEIADETGMLLWQEHPNWHAPMEDEDVEEFRRLYAEFLRRDRNHPSIVIVSATCEHPCFHPEVGAWWWREARRMLPETLLQVQTSSFAWSDPDQTDLYDEHTYDNNNRWITYLEDLQDTLAALPPKPFVMGETICFNDWPDIDSIREQNVQSRAWSLPGAHESMSAFEMSLRHERGGEVLDRFRRQAHRHNLLGRKFQVEMFRRYPNHAGLVMNNLRDVFGSSSGFMDALGRWRFEPDETRGWLCDSPLVLMTPDERRSFESGETIGAEILVSNFGHREFHSEVLISLDGHVARQARMSAGRGEIGRTDVHLTAPDAHAPQRARIEASSAATNPNAWDLWVFPERASNPEGIYRLSGLPFEAGDAEADPLERGYSRGFGLPVKRWVNRLPDTALLAPDVPGIQADQAPPSDAIVVLTHRLTQPLLDFICAGGRAMLLASKARGGIGAVYDWFFGQCPFVDERGPIGEGDSDWIVDLLGFDLTRTYAKMFPIEAVGWRDRVTPFVRLVYIHDQRRVRFYDMMFAARVGEGALLVSSFDHSFPAGQHLLRRSIEWLASANPGELNRLGREDLTPHLAV